LLADREDGAGSNQSDIDRTAFPFGIQKQHKKQPEIKTFYSISEEFHPMTGLLFPLSGSAQGTSFPVNLSEDPETFSPFIVAAQGHWDAPLGADIGLNPPGSLEPLRPGE
jgi:hypothetical protein